LIPFISTDDLSAYLGETVDGGELLTQIALDAGCQAVRDELEQTVNLVTDDVELHDGDGRESLILRELPVVNVTSVTEDDELLVEDDDYVVDLRLGILRRRSTDWPLGWSIGRQNIEIVYDHGWTVTEGDVEEGDPEVDAEVIDRVPSTIRLAALAMAARIFRAPTLTSVVSGQVTEETIGGYSYRSDPSVAAVIASGLTDGEKVSISRWKPGA